MNTTKNLALRKPLLISAWLLAMQGATYAQNPIVQTQLTTDPAPLVVGDRLYVYTGHDEDKADFFWMNEWRVYSTKDMVNWTDHGSPLDLSSFSWADDRAWAAQTIERNGKYYWYICAHSKLTGGMAIGVAVADSPTGPFKDALGKPHLRRESLPLFPATRLGNIKFCHQFAIFLIEMNLQRTSKRRARRRDGKCIRTLISEIHLTYLDIITCMDF